MVQEILHIDKRTGLQVSYTPVENFADGTVMDDSKCDGTIYRKIKENEYVRLNFLGAIHAKFFGVIGDGITDDTVAMQKAIDMCAKLGIVLDMSGLVILFNRINIKCSLHGGLLRTAQAPLKGGVSAEISGIGLSFEDVTFDGNLRNWTADEWDGAGNPANATGTTACYIHSACRNLKFVRCKFQNSMGNCVIISGKGHRFHFCDVNRAAGGWGDGFAVYMAEDIEFNYCKVYDFQRIGFVSDTSVKNIRYNNCIAEYGHDSSREWGEVSGGGEANAGFWAENTIDVSWINCSAKNTGVNGIVYNQSTPQGDSWFTQTKSSVLIKDCIIDFTRENSGVLGAGIVIQSNIPADGSTLEQNAMYAIVSGCKIDVDSRVGINLRVDNAYDYVLIENTYISRRFITTTIAAAESRDIEHYQGIFIQAGLQDATTARCGTVDIKNVEFNFSNNADFTDVKYVYMAAKYTADIAVVRWGDGIKKIRLNIAYCRNKKAYPVVVKTWYSDINRDDVKIYNCEEVWFGGKCENLTILNVQKFAYAYLNSNTRFKNLDIKNAVVRCVETDVLASAPLWMSGALVLENCTLNSCFFLPKKMPLFRNNTLPAACSIQIIDGGKSRIEGNSFQSALDGNLNISYNADLELFIYNNIAEGNAGINIYPASGNVSVSIAGSGNITPAGKVGARVNGIEYTSTTHPFLFLNKTDVTARRYGSTAQRPISVSAGFEYLDTDLKKKIIYWGTADGWKDVLGNAL